ncbi:TIGR02677 family protein [Actinopolyspora mzabensis]|uniref:TIGR02677 family protein n=2 Tax=Actinopolyspora mzabensis TaxID=995066 RepID=A0A1G8XD71_ACTMZ|nr:TIGR02677 family protein [Actinopolyspora mzabensis]
MQPLRVPSEMFRFTTGDRSELYSAILHAFGEANERLETALSIDEVRERLRSVGWFDALSDEDLHAALKQLGDWGLLDNVQNHAENYRTAAEYERRNLQYSLTKLGEAAFAGVQHAMATLASSGALQTAVLDAIADRLGELNELLRDPTSADRRIFSSLQELEGHLEALRNNTKQFNAELQRLLRAEGVDLTTFHEVKSATVAYLQEFCDQLEQRCHAIASGITEVEDRGVAELHRRALRGAELPPGTGDERRTEWLDHRATRWQGLRIWFHPEDDSAPRAEQLLTVARQAIVTLLQVLERIDDSRKRSSSVASDFRELARWFTRAPDEDELHRLFAAAFGLGSARHAQLIHEDPEVIAPSTSWADAPAVGISATLRTGGRKESFARTGRVRDVAELKRQRAELARAERAQLEAAWQRLATDGRARLSDFAELDHTVFQRLLELLGRALAAGRDESGARRASTPDGRAEIELRDPDDRGETTLRTPHGTFTGPDFAVDIRIVGRDLEEPAREAS